MKYTIQLNPQLLKNPNLTISDLVDALKENEQTKDMAISVSFLDHSKNTVIIYASSELSQFLNGFFNNQIKIGALKIGELTHHSGHTTFLDKDGLLKCGCGWIETETEKQDRETSKQLESMKIIPIDLGL